MRGRVTEGKHIYANNADVHGKYVDSVDKHFGHIDYAPNYSGTLHGDNYFDLHEHVRQSNPAHYFGQHGSHSNFYKACRKAA